MFRTKCRCLVVSTSVLYSRSPVSNHKLPFLCFPQYFSQMPESYHKVDHNHFSYPPHLANINHLAFFMWDLVDL